MSIPTLHFYILHSSTNFIDQSTQDKTSQDLTGNLSFLQLTARMMVLLLNLLHSDRFQVKFWH